MSEWLDLRLVEELRPVKAPEELWMRVLAGRRSPARTARWWTIRMPALVCLAVVVLIAALQSRRQTGTLESLAARELEGSMMLDLRSSDAAEIAAWLRREGGVDVAIPHASKVQLRGARVIRRRDTRIGEVAYTVGGNTALLLVAPAGGFYRAPARHGGTVWQSGRQVYAIACPVPLAACALCHANL
jgi:hypothetical protein